MGILIKKSRPNGFLLIESLLALLVSSVVSLLVIAFLQMSVVFIQIKDTSQTEFAILQLRQELALCQSVVVCDNELHVIMNHEEKIYKFDSQRLIKTPGYEIFIEGIQKGKFYEENQKIYIEIDKESFQVR